MSIEKKILREQMIAKRNLLSECQHIQMSESLCHRICSFEPYCQADLIFAFHPFGSEPKLIPILEDCIKQGKCLLLPKTFGKRHMEFFQVTSFTGLVPGKFGIMEPDEHCLRFEPDNETFSGQKAVMLVPGTAFCLREDSQLPVGRMGYGGGYYDTYLEHLRNTAGIDIVTAGICFDFQKVSKEDLPIEPVDQFLNVLITDRQVYE